MENASSPITTQFTRISASRSFCNSRIVT
ncbi:hypothetical protein ACRE_048630 [Hapsidospora chrysogenum ATCC 11550]|uniref:Uncharacterized protein n=1 Tax=Hapsidospora chrysogenum (strain ATCC 11550 / CBS 779.69 / DSM 880 / IAM 14645 / JCM 23072 / IMI 49137) TaxID=857340 RepID=A0A086T4N6_HAPC1|nr:hypothetical protein ACRE_048630 [Hapsidospora chrysogenum ATCC 11550]